MKSSDFLHLTYGNPGEHTEVDSHKPFPQTWRLKPTHTPVSPPGTTRARQYPRRGPFLLNGSAGLLLRKTRHAVTQRASASLCTKCTRFDIIVVLYTCTTVASRVATNACATHLRFLTQPQTPSGLASSPLRRYRGPGVVMT